MRFRQFALMFADRVAAWLTVIHRKLCGTSPQSAQAPGIDDFARPPRRSLSKDLPVAAHALVVNTGNATWLVRTLSPPFVTSYTNGPNY